MKHLIIFLSFIFLISCSDEKTPFPEPKPSPDLPDETDNSITLYEEIIEYQSDYITALQSQDGSIAIDSIRGSAVVPYFSNLACYALLSKPTTKNINVIKKWIDWYILHLNGDTNKITGEKEIPGSIYDYSGSPLSTTGTYDSVDSYAATFLLLIDRLISVAPNEVIWLEKYAPQIKQVADAMIACMDTENNNIERYFSSDDIIFYPDDDDYLTIASFKYRAKYLMDNCEVNFALKALVNLSSVFFKDGMTEHYQMLLNKNTLGIESQLWREKSYNWYDANTVSEISDWSNLYADALAQLFPILFNVIDSSTSRAHYLYTTFNKFHQNWYIGDESRDTQWALIAMGGARVNDRERVDTYLKFVRRVNKDGRQINGWLLNEAAFLIMAADEMIKNQDKPLF